MTNVRQTTGPNESDRVVESARADTTGVSPSFGELDEVDPGQALQQALEAHRERYRTQRFRTASVEQSAAEPYSPEGPTSTSATSMVRVVEVAADAVAAPGAEGGWKRARERLLLAMLLPAIVIASMLLLGPAILGRGVLSQQGAEPSGSLPASAAAYASSKEATRPPGSEAAASNGSSVLPAAVQAENGSEQGELVRVQTAQSDGVGSQGSESPGSVGAGEDARGGKPDAPGPAVATQDEPPLAAKRRAAELASAERGRRIAEERAARLRAVARRERKLRRDRRAARRVAATRAAQQALERTKEPAPPPFTAVKVPRSSALPQREPFGWVASSPPHHRGVHTPP